MTASARTFRLPQTWRDFAAFLRAPRVPEPSGLRAPGAWLTTGAMFGLNLIGLAVLLGALTLWQKVSGVGDPVAFEMFPTKYLIPLAVLAAPLLEETVFRGWLRGRPRSLWLMVCLIAAIAIPMLTPLSPNQTVAVLVATLVAALGGWLALRKRPAAAWFTGNFTAIFYASAVIFGLVHVFNYGEVTPAVLPMILPQVWAGLTLGFLRLRVGLPAAMLVHGASNALALTLAAVSA